MGETFWESERWKSYEQAYGDEPGTRAKLLAEADFNTRIVDLSLRTEQLWRGVRKSYRPIINKAKGCHGGPTELEFKRWKTASPFGTHVGAAMRLHAEVAGRETRPSATWQHMYEWAERGRGMTQTAWDDSNLQAFAYFAIHDTWAYYFSAASLERDLGLALIWWSMLALKERGVRWVELGWQGAATNEKERNIEFVRRGFGGKDVPASWSGRALMEEEWDEHG